MILRYAEYVALHQEACERLHIEAGRMLMHGVTGDPILNTGRIVSGYMTALVPSREMANHSAQLAERIGDMVPSFLPYRAEQLCLPFMVTSDWVNPSLIAECVGGVFGNLHATKDMVQLLWTGAFCGSQRVFATVLPNRELFSIMRDVALCALCRGMMSGNPFTEMHLTLGHFREALPREEIEGVLKLTGNFHIQQSLQPAAIAVSRFAIGREDVEVEIVERFTFG